MIFSEIYGEYFNAVAKILDTAVRGELNENDIISIVGESAFGESILSLPQKIKNEKWGLLTSDLKTPIKNKPQMHCFEDVKSVSEKHFMGQIGG